MSDGWGPCLNCGATCDTGCCSPGCANAMAERDARRCGYCRREAEPLDDGTVATCEQCDLPVCGDHMSHRDPDGAAICVECNQRNAERRDLANFEDGNRA